MDHILKVLDKVSLEKCRVLYRPYICFVCGGDTDALSDPYMSGRDGFLKEASKLRKFSDVILITAETYNNWQSVYKSLSVFQNDLASISSSVIVFPETPGSLVELGMFFENSLTKPKLSAVVHQKHAEEDSFIRLGLLEDLRLVSSCSVLSYNIPERRPQDANPDDLKQAAEEVFEKLDGGDASVSFDASKTGHIIFLVYQVTHLSGALLLNEIKDAVEYLGVVLEEKRLRQFLYTLIKFKLLKTVAQGSRKFYVSLTDEVRVDFNSTAELGRFEYLSERISIASQTSRLASSDRLENNRQSVVSKKESSI